MHGDVRLKSMNESDVKEGHVELCLDGVWSRICDTSSWTNTDAIVVCRQILGAENIMGKMIFYVIEFFANQYYENVKVQLYSNDFIKA